jgi:hypothetical protein
MIEIVRPENIIPAVLASHKILLMSDIMYIG